MDRTSRMRQVGSLVVCTPNLQLMAPAQCAGIFHGGCTGLVGYETEVSIHYILTGVDFDCLVALPVITAYFYFAAGSLTRMPFASFLRSHRLRLVRSKSWIKVFGHSVLVTLRKHCMGARTC